MHFENLFFILLGLAFVILRWLTQRAADSKRNSQGNEPERPTRAPAETDEERVRRFMEALGNPVGSKPPPKVTPRPLQQQRTILAEAKRQEFERQAKLPRKTIWTGGLPPLTTTPAPPPAAKRVTLPQLITNAPLAQKTPGQFPPTATYVAATRQPKPLARPLDLQSLLSSPDGLRNAVLLREILGPPRGVKPLDAV